jgi:hypothetical protein
MQNKAGALATVALAIFVSSCSGGSNNAADAGGGPYYPPTYGAGGSSGGGAAGAAGTGTAGAGGTDVQPEAGVDDGDGSTGEGGSTAPECAAQSVDACVSCCQQAHPRGYQVVEGSAFQCVCVKPGPCAKNCGASVCASPPVAAQSGDSCDTCINSSLQDSGACNQPVVSACNAEPDCGAYVTCVQACK